MKNISRIILLSILSIGFIYAGCGSCNVSKNKSPLPMGDFVTKVNQDGTVKGLVLASCGMCNFGTKDRTCSLSIQINEKAYNVKGTHIDDHGDSHASDGFCNAVRVAKVSGKVKKDNFIAETFVLQKN
tara:strand:+ start:100 stop:483 length:384 start_codon:yes stop_codon:yes gene_type:complete